jgi:hypothetical protein
VINPIIAEIGTVTMYVKFDAFTTVAHQAQINQFRFRCSQFENGSDCSRTRGYALFSVHPNRPRANM